MFSDEIIKIKLNESVCKVLVSLLLNVRKNNNTWNAMSCNIFYDIDWNREEHMLVVIVNTWNAGYVYFP